jgi:hypothetical protein
MTRVNNCHVITLNTISVGIILKPRPNVHIIAHIGQQTSMLAASHVQIYCRHANQDESTQSENIPKVLFTR